MTAEAKYNRRFRTYLVIAVILLSLIYIKCKMIKDEQERKQSIEHHP